MKTESEENPRWLRESQRNETSLVEERIAIPSGRTMHDRPGPPEETRRRPSRLTIRLLFRPMGRQEVQLGPLGDRPTVGLRNLDRRLADWAKPKPSCTRIIHRQGVSVGANYLNRHRTSLPIAPQEFQDACFDASSPSRRVSRPQALPQCQTVRPCETRASSTGPLLLSQFHIPPPSYRPTAFPDSWNSSPPGVLVPRSLPYPFERGDVDEGIRRLRR